MSPDHESTVRYYKGIQERVSEDLNELRQWYGFSEINLIGISLGCVNALMVANHNPLVDKINLVVPGHCLAESMWNGVRTQKMRQAFEDNGVTLEQLKEYWHDLAPENNIDGLEGKGITVRISLADKVIPHYCGKSLIESMEKLGLNPVVRENSYLGHYCTVVSFYFSPTDITLSHPSSQ